MALPGLTIGPVGVATGTGVVVLLRRSVVVVLETPEALLGEEEPEDVLEPGPTVADAVRLELEELEELAQGMESHPGVYLVVS